MQRKTSITLSDEVLDELDRVAGNDGSERSEQEARDLELIDAAADELNSEMAEVLALQAAWAEDE